ncbi:hypothetical protein ACWDLG_22595 [Nonomuraea sp. NPDC003727]
MRLKVIFTLFALYAVTAAPEFLPGEGRVILQPATADAVEVYCQPVSPVLRRSYEGIGPFQRPFRITPLPRPAENSHAALTALMEEEPGPISESAVVAMGIRPELNRVVLRANAFDQGDAGAARPSRPANIFIRIRSLKKPLRRMTRTLDRQLGPGENPIVNRRSWRRRAGGPSRA